MMFIFMANTDKTDESLSEGIFSTEDLEINKLLIGVEHDGSYIPVSAVTELLKREHRFLKAEVEKVINEMLKEGLNGERYNFIINGEELKKRLFK